MIQEWIRHAAEAKPKGGVALLIDAAFFRASDADQILAMAMHKGNVAIRRAYGNAADLAPWEGDPRFTRITTATESATGIRMAMDAIDLAHQGSASVFMIAAQNVEIAPLASRMREIGVSVIGVGPEGTADVLRRACCEFRTLG